MRDQPLASFASSICLLVLEPVSTSCAFLVGCTFCSAVPFTVSLLVLFGFLLTSICRDNQGSNVVTLWCPRILSPSSLTRYCRKSPLPIPPSPSPPSHPPPFLIRLKYCILSNVTRAGSRKFFKEICLVDFRNFMILVNHQVEAGAWQQEETLERAKQHRRVRIFVRNVSWLSFHRSEEWRNFSTNSKS